MSTETVPVARIDLGFSSPGEVIREAVLRLLPAISGDAATMKANLELMFKDIGEAPLTISFAQTETGVSVVFFKDIEKSNLILPI